jgi:hypothetical protein
MASTLSPDAEHPPHAYDSHTRLVSNVAQELHPTFPANPLAHLPLPHDHSSSYAICSRLRALPASALLVEPLCPFLDFPGLVAVDDQV